MQGLLRLGAIFYAGVREFWVLGSVRFDVSRAPQVLQDPCLTDAGL